MIHEEFVNFIKDETVYRQMQIKGLEIYFSKPNECGHCNFIINGYEIRDMHEWHVFSLGFIAGNKK